MLSRLERWSRVKGEVTISPIGTTSSQSTDISIDGGGPSGGKDRYEYFCRLETSVYPIP